MTTITTHQGEQVKITETRVATGVAAATLISSGIGALVLGLMTTGAVVIEGLKGSLNWWNPAGSLTGKSSVAVIAWLISWALLNTLWKGKDVDLRKSYIITLVLIGLGVLFTYPPFFEAFK
ncbi:hypothetical protein MNBD_CHLOROFLEXI01-3375 [hydrothermal vent metagenome]|uniref:Uncharacterized protein n=1 Tax=hydrothermal vent metagenome TaxID=652676 RepID=A0A3B0VGW0_9ZZZZ